MQAKGWESHFKIPGRRFAYLTALTLGLAYLGCFTTLSVLRFEGFHSRSFDLAIVVRMLWGIRHGDFHETFTNQPWLAYHFEPILLPLSLIDAFLPTGSGLLILQTLALALAAVPAYRLGDRVLGAGGGVAASVAILLYPVLGQVNVFEFHPVALAIAPGIWMLEALDRRAFRQAIVAGALVATCREDGLVFVALALFSLPRKAQDERLNRGRLALGLGCIGFYALYAFGIQPWFGKVGSVRAHFGAFGATPTEIVTNALLDPLRLIRHLFSGPKIAYLVSLLLPFAFLPLLAPRRALPAAFTVAINLFSGFATATQIVDSHYSALAVPGLFVGATFGAARLQRFLLPHVRARYAHAVPAGLLVAGAALGAVMWGAFPGTRGHNGKDYVVDHRTEAIRTFLKPIHAAPAATVSVPIDVVAHVARRPHPRVFPDGLPNVDFAIVDFETQGVFGASAATLRRHYMARTAHARRDGMTVYGAIGPLVALKRDGP